MEIINIIIAFACDGDKAMTNQSNNDLRNHLTLEQLNALTFEYPF